MMKLKFQFQGLFKKKFILVLRIVQLEQLCGFNLYFRKKNILIIFCFVHTLKNIYVFLLTL